MPNHITNKLELIGSLEAIDALIKRFGTYMPARVSMTAEKELVICKHKTEKYGYCWLDLKTGVASNRDDMDRLGLPDDYEIEVKDSFLCFPDFEKVIPPPDDPAYKDLPSQKVAERSPNWWYRWNIDNWGTKWSGYSYERPAINVFTFETAWSSVPKIIEVMSLAFPSVTIKYTWADEDTGSNCGQALYTNGLLQENIPESGSREAYELAFELHPDDAKNYELVGDTYRYKEE